MTGKEVHGQAEDILHKHPRQDRDVDKCLAEVAAIIGDIDGLIILAIHNDDTLTIHRTGSVAEALGELVAVQAALLDERRWQIETGIPEDNENEEDEPC